MTATIAGALAHAALALAPAQAATAVFVTPANPSPGQVGALSTSGDGAGYQLFLGQTLSLLFSDPIVAVAGPRTSVFTIAPPAGRIDVIVRAGLFNSGAPIILGQRSVRAGGSVDLVGAVRATCTLFGGCDYLEFLLGGERNGANSATIDYVSVGGELVQVSGPDPVSDVPSPTPEPQIWVLMILGFAAIAWRLKSQRPVPTNLLPV